MCKINIWLSPSLFDVFFLKVRSHLVVDLGDILLIRCWCWKCPKSDFLSKIRPFQTTFTEKVWFQTKFFKISQSGRTEGFSLLRACIIFFHIYRGLSLERIVDRGGSNAWGGTSLPHWNMFIQFLIYFKDLFHILHQMLKT